MADSTPASVPPVRTTGLRQGGGILGFFVRHRTAANLLMLLTLAAGALALIRLNTQFFPNFGIDVVVVRVAWPGASAGDIDQAIIRAIEPRVRFLDNVHKVQSTASRSLASVRVEFEAFTNMQEALGQVEAAVAEVTDLPADAEKPEIFRAIPLETISRILISGPFDESALKQFARDLRDRLLQAGADQVTLRGTRDEEILVEIEPGRLRALGLTVEQIAQRIRALSQDVPSGDLSGGERQIRALGLRRSAAELGGIEIIADSGGRVIRLRDIATIREGFRDGQPQLYRNGQLAVELHVQRSRTSDALGTGEAIDQFLQTWLPSVPPTLNVETHDNSVDLIEDRIDLLVRNALFGLALVLGILFLFLRGPAAFWIAVGIPIALLTCFWVMLLTGQSINMISLFAIIMMIGLVVDEAIVVGEHIEYQRRQGLSPHDAAVTGARRMIAPVGAAVLTTMAAFLPLFLVTGVIGQIMQAIPMVAVTVLIASMFESFLILPGHMHHALRERPRSASARRRRKGPVRIARLLLARFRRRFDRGFERFRNGFYRQLVVQAIRFRHTVTVGVLGMLVIALALPGTGRLNFSFFSGPESDRAFAVLEMVGGTGRAETFRALRTVEASLNELAREYEAEGQPGLIRTSLLTLGNAPAIGGPGGNEVADTRGGMRVELVPGDQRDLRTGQLIEQWRERIPPIPGLSSLVIRAPSGGPPGRDVDIRLSGEDPLVLKQAAEQVKGLLRSYGGVSAIEDNLPWGQPEEILTLTPRGRALQFDTRNLANQIRDAFEGRIALRFPRGEEEVAVRVRFPPEAARGGALDALWLRGPAGDETRLGDVVARTEQNGLARIRSANGVREVSITADIDKTRTTTDQIVQRLRRDGIERIAGDLTLSFAGKSEEQAETFSDMALGGILAIFGMYFVLSWVFASYSLSVIVMAIIPFGVIGVIWGHWLMGFNLSILSVIGLMGLAGIIVNDSIVMVNAVLLYARTLPWREAIVAGACSRLRAVILTSLTTILGLVPMLFETSLQARFLLPMVITLIFGLAVGMVMVLGWVPAMLAFWSRPPGGVRESE